MRTSFSAFGALHRAPTSVAPPQLVKKVSREKPPPTAAWSGKSIAEDATHGVMRSLEYRARGNPDEEVLSLPDAVFGRQALRWTNMVADAASVMYPH